MLKKVLCLLSIFLFAADSFFSADYYAGDLAEGAVLLAKATKKPSKKKSKKVEEPEEEIVGEVTAISVDKDRGGSGYFSGINKNILELVDNGSAEALLLKASE